MQTYIKVMIAKASGNFENFNNEISLAKAYYTQQGKYNAQSMRRRKQPNY